MNSKIVKNPNLSFNETKFNNLIKDLTSMDSANWVFFEHFQKIMSEDAQFYFIHPNQTIMDSMLIGWIAYLLPEEIEDYDNADDEDEKVFINAYNRIKTLMLAEND
jgi:hypothetical protein